MQVVKEVGLAVVPAMLKVRVPELLIENTPPFYYEDELAKVDLSKVTATLLVPPM